MKTKELIAELLKADPTGEGEVCVGNCDIYYVEKLPAYYDGCLQRLIRDSEKKGWNIVAAKYTAEGYKISIRPLSIGDAIFDDKDLPVTCEGMSEQSAASYQKSVAARRQETEDVHNDSERRLFTEYMVKRLTPYEGDFDEDEIRSTCEKFFDCKMSHEDKMPADIAKLSIGHSWYSKRCLQWDRGIAVDLVDGKLTLGFTDQYTD